MFGREARLPVDICFGVSADNTSTVSYSKYVSKIKQELQAAYQLAQATSEKMNQSYKARYDQKVRYHSLNVGDRVLIRESQSLRDWRVNSSIPVYRLKPVDVMDQSESSTVWVHDPGCLHDPSAHAHNDVVENVTVSLHYWYHARNT